MAKKKKKGEPHPLKKIAYSIQSFKRHHSKDGCAGGAPKYCADYNESSSKGATEKSAVHHVLPVSAESGYWRVYQDNEPIFEKIRAAYANADHCVNIKNNLERMLYLPEFAKRIRAQGSLGSEMPAHDLDHAKYTQEVVEKLKSEIWDRITDPPEGEPCMTPDQMKIVFKAQEDAFRQNLKDRATRKLGLSGTADKFRKKEELPEGWFECFSMADGSGKWPVTPLYTFRSAPESQGRRKKRQNKGK